jgi:hypothetical protein
MTDIVMALDSLKNGCQCPRQQCETPRAGRVGPDKHRNDMSRMSQENDGLPIGCPRRAKSLEESEE